MRRFTKYFNGTRLLIGVLGTATACAVVAVLATFVPEAASARANHHRTWTGGSSVIVTNSWSTGGGGKILSETCPTLSASRYTPLRVNFMASSSGVGQAAQHVLVLVSGPAYVAGGSNLTTGYGGLASATVVPYGAGIVSIRGAWDFNGDGSWNPAFEPSAVPVCSVSVS